jgi:hypothetical protein
MVARHLGGCGEMQYGRIAMRANWQRPATRMLLVLVVLLASAWTGGAAAPAAGQPVSHLTASHVLPGIEPAVLRDRLPALRPPVDRPSQSGRPMPVLLGMLVVAFAVGCGVRRGRTRPGAARAWSLVQLTQLEARAPPSLQSA